MSGLLQSRRMRSSGARIPSAFALLAIGACGGGGGGGTDLPASYTVFVQSTDPVVSTGHVDLFGSTTCDACPPSETAFGGCPVLRGPFDSSIEVLWHNVTTGESGNAFHSISGQCGCLFSYCTVTYAHRFLASVPLAIGKNEVEILALGPQYEPGSSTVAITRVPRTPTGVVAVSEHNAITLSWAPVAEAESYELLWSLSPDLDAATTPRIVGVTSPYLHAGLPDDVTHYFAVVARANGYASARSDVVWATTGWRAEDLPATAATWTPAAIAIALDSLDRVHVHVSRLEFTDPWYAQHNEYLTDASGTWTSTPIAGVQQGDASIAVDAQGTVHLGYVGGGMVHASVSSFGAWTLETVDAFASCRSSLALDTFGRAHAVYAADFYDTAWHGELRAASNATGAWVVRTLDAADLGCGYPGVAPRIAVDASGTVHIAYVGVHPGYGLQYAASSGGAWTRSTVTPDFVRGMALAVDAQGTPHVVYSDAGAQLRHARLEPAGEWTIEPIDTVQAVAPSIAVDGSGNLHACYAAAAHELRYATNASGAWRVALVDGEGYGLEDRTTALALDSQGRVHVATFGAHGPRYATNR
ncbi:MAG: hypothetical protein HZA53_12735 [Planctomycetes bacterium]|nr:hypothetical protein [Planctomycetota bacterium]